jgi:anti-anti-sigma regulatory factor
MATLPGVMTDTNSPFRTGLFRCIVVVYDQRDRIVNEPSKGISVGCKENRVYVRVVGRGTFLNSQPLRLFALQKIDEGQREFVLDLGQCPGMDSTFLGMLAGIGLRLRQHGQLGTVHIVNISPRNLELLQTLGLDRLFTMNSNAPSPLAEADCRKLSDTDLTQITHPLHKDETADLMIEAHDNLVRADERNAPKFRELTRFLREAIERRHRNQDTQK